MSSSRGLQGITSLFGFRGLSSSPTTKSDTDSGVGVDGSEVVTFTITGTDIGVGVDGSEVLAPAIPSTDAGVGVDGAEVIAATVPDTDAGTGADDEVPSGGYEGQVPSTDSGKVVETASVAVTLSDTDSGVGVDTGTLATDRDLEVCITSIAGDLTVKLDITSEECE